MSQYKLFMKYNYFNRKVVFTISLLVTVCSIWAEKAPMKYGKVDQADLHPHPYQTARQVAANEAQPTCDQNAFALKK